MASTTPPTPDRPSPEPEEETSVHVRGAIGGSAVSLDWLIDHLSPLLLVQASWRLGPVLRPHYDAEDLVADAWARLLPRLAELPARDGRHTPVLLGFLATTIANRASNLVEKHIRMIRSGRGAHTSGDALAHLPASITGAVTACLRRERASAVRDALDELGSLDRQIVLLRAIEQHPNADVAATLAITPDAAAMRFSRALRRLRERLPANVFDEIDEDP